MFANIRSKIRSAAVSIPNATDNKNCPTYFQFVTYDANDFIADVGGYLGLLMGQSILALYDLGNEYFKKYISWYQKMRKTGHI